MSSIASGCEPSRWPPSSATSARPAGPWGSIPRPSTGGGPAAPLRPGDPAAPGTAAPEDGQPDQPVDRAAGGGLRPGPPRLRTGADRRRAGAPKWGGIVLSTNGVLRVLRRHGLNTRAKRLGLVAGYAAPPEPERPRRRPSGTCRSPDPGSWSRSTASSSAGFRAPRAAVWQYTAIDVASAYCWAELHVTPRNPRPAGPPRSPGRSPPTWPRRGWRLERVMTDNASEFRSADFGQTVAGLGARHRFIRAGRPQTNGCRRAGPADHPGRVLEAGLRPLPDPQVDRPPARPGTLPALLQHRPRPHRALDQGPDPRGGPREGEDVGTADSEVSPHLGVRTA